MGIFDKDWFSRRSNYIVKDESKSIGWDSSFVSEFSKYLYSASKASQICMNKSVMIVEFREIMNSVNLKHDVECYINDENDLSYTDGKMIVVSSDCLNDNELSSFNKLDIMIGLLIHECAHCLYSDFKNIIKDLKTNKDKYAKDIQNILEDEIIEEKLCLRWPGNANFISTVKERYFKNTINDIVESKPKNFIDEIFVLLLLVIRYPERLKEYVDKASNKETIEKLFTEIHGVIYKSGYFNVGSNFDVTRKTKALAYEIVEIIKEYISDAEMSNQLEECYGDDKDNNDGKESDNKENTNTLMSSIKKYENAVAKIVSETEALGIAQRTVNNKINELKECIEDDKNKESLINRDITESSISKTIKGRIVVTDKQKYDEIVSNIKRQIFKLSKDVIVNKPKEKLLIINNMRNGLLNTSKIAEAYQGIEYVYDKNIIKKDYTDKLAKYALVIIIDESGSMELAHEITQTISVLFYEAFKNEKEIEVFVFGHGDRVNVYIDKNFKNKYVLACTNKQNNQDEVASYKKIMNHVHSQTKLNAVVISLTDSYYCFNKTKFENTLKHFNEKYNDSFNLVKLEMDDPTYEYGIEETADVCKTNNEIYGEGNWMNVIYDANNKKENVIKTIDDIVEKFIPILRKNYLKSEKLHR